MVVVALPIETQVTVREELDRTLNTPITSNNHNRLLINRQFFKIFSKSA